MTATSDAPDLAIIVPHYNDVPRLVRCLEALAPQIVPGVELVVVDNASTDDLGPARAAHPGLRLLTQPKRGAAEARNLGVARTTAPHLAFIDADCVAAPDWVARARAVAAAQGDAVTGGRVDVFDETPAPRSGAEAFETVFAFDFRTYIEKKGFTGAGNMVTSRAAFEATGPFVHGLSEDLDWSTRAVAAGFPLRYDDDLVVAHPTRTDWDALRRKWRRLTDETWALAARDGRGGGGHGAGARVRWALRAVLGMPASIPAHAPRVMRHPALSAPERRAALATLGRLRLLRARWMLAQALGRGGSA